MKDLRHIIQRCWWEMTGTLRTALVVFFFGLAAGPALAQSTTEIEPREVRAWFEEVLNKLKEIGPDIGVDVTDDRIDLSWSTGWQPPGAAAVTKVDATVSLWRVEEAAINRFQSDVERAFKDDWRSKWQSPRFKIELAEGAAGTIGTHLDKTFIYDEDEKRWRPQAIVEGFFSCGGITARIRAEVRDGLLPEVKKEERPADAAEGWVPSFLKAKENVEAAAAAVDKARSAISTLTTRIDALLNERRICSVPKPVIDLPDHKRVNTLEPVFRALGWEIEVFEGSTLAEIKEHYPHYEADMQAFMRSDSILHQNPKDVPLLGGWEGDLFVVSADGRLSYSTNKGDIELAKYITADMHKDTWHGLVTLEEGTRTKDVAPMLWFANIGGLGANTTQRNKTQYFIEAVGTLVCGEISIRFVFARWGPVIPLSDEVLEKMTDAEGKALEASLQVKAAEHVPQVMDELDKRMEMFRAEMQRQSIPCPTDEEFTEAKPEPRFRRLDANVLFTPGHKGPGTLSAADLSKLDETRLGTVADGLSRLILEVEAGAAGDVTFRIDDGDGHVVALDWSGEGTPGNSLTVATSEANGRHLAYALYLPPAELGEHTRELDGVGIRDIAVTASPADGAPVEIPIVLARPPVLLVHGTFSTPEKWTEASGPLGGNSMVDALRDAGLAVFLVDYELTNGSKSAGPSGFRNNAGLLWDPFPHAGNAAEAGGVFKALKTFREDLGLAATQVDVVGHSLGGLIPRVYASSSFQRPGLGTPDQTMAWLASYATPGSPIDGAPPYLRPDNQNRGDIRRLITLCTPHYGSDLPRVIEKLEDVKIADETFRSWATRKAFSRLGAYLAGLSKGASRDQIPESEELRAIGATEIAAHAIGCTADLAELSRTIFDDAARADRNGTYVRDYALIAAFFGLSPKSLEIFANELRPNDNKGRILPSSVLDLLPPEKRKPRSSTAGNNTCSLRPETPVRVGIDDHERLADQIARIDVYKWQARYDNAATVATGFAKFRAGIPPFKPKCSAWYDCALGDLLTEPIIDEKQLLQTLRAAIFGNTPNDGVVRLESQLGGLDAQYITIFDKIVHGEAPIYARVQTRVAELLLGPPTNFAPTGFPAAGKAPADLPPGLSDQPARDRALAIGRSNIVPAHAEALSRLAHARNEIILARPVNADSTALIAKNDATKSMHVKGKSADWGPHAGYIPVDQSYSKLARLAAEKDPLKQAGKYNCEVVKTFNARSANGAEIARRKALVLDIGGKSYNVLRVTDQPALPAMPVLVLQDADGAFFDWRNVNVAPSVPVSAANTAPLEVLTPAPETPDGKDTGHYLTADYDLHSIGTRYTRQVDPVPKDIHPDMGFITTCQIELVGEINKVMKAQTGYTGGNVVHHGPESQFGGSPGNDYPVTIFEPGNLGGWIITIGEGPKDDPDLYLKEYFALKTGEGWTLRPNKQWNWGEIDPDTKQFAPPTAPATPAEISDDNDTEEEPPPAKIGEQCEPLPACGTGTGSGNWKIAGGIAPDAIGCWP